MHELSETPCAYFNIIIVKHTPSHVALNKNSAIGIRDNVFLLLNLPEVAHFPLHPRDCTTSTSNHVANNLVLQDTRNVLGLQVVLDMPPTDVKVLQM
ncbi:hypothetical protein ACQRIU_001784 [Beauveria bassiana]